MLQVVAESPYRGSNCRPEDFDKQDVFEVEWFHDVQLQSWSPTGKQKEAIN